MTEKPHLTPYLIQTLDGRSVPAERGRIRVPENRLNPEGNWREINASIPT